MSRSGAAAVTSSGGHTDRGVSSPAQPTLGPGRDSELTWLLHRAAQRMHSATGEAAAHHGLTLRQHIVLSAMSLAPGMTQVELSRAVGMDKTTLTSELDRLERLSLIQRGIDPRDRRAHTLTVTARGEKLRRAVSVEAETAERAALAAFTDTDVARLRRMLYDIIGDSRDSGTCL